MLKGWRAATSWESNPDLSVCHYHLNMEVLVCLCLLICVRIQTAQSVIPSRQVTEGGEVSIECNMKTESRVTWSRDTDGRRVDILTADSTNNKRTYGPDTRFSSVHFTLLIEPVSLSDSGIYYCNGHPVENLTVTSSGNRENPDKSRTREKPAERLSTRQTTARKQTQISTTRQPVTIKTPQTLSRTQAEKRGKPKIFTTKPTTVRGHGTQRDKDNSVKSTTRGQPTDRSTTRKITEKQTTPGSTSGQTPPGQSQIDKGHWKIPVAMGIGLLVMTLFLLLWINCSKRKAVPQRPNEALYSLAGDPNVEKPGRKNQTEDVTYSVIQHSQLKEGNNGLKNQREDVTYSDIKHSQTTQDNKNNDHKQTDPVYSTVQTPDTPN